MRMRLAAILIVMLGVLIGVGTANADSSFTYPDGSRSQAFNLGNGIAFVFFDLPGDGDIFIHPVDFFANTLRVAVNSTFTGFALWLDFEGFNQGYQQYGVYSCDFSLPCSFGSRRGTLLL